MPVNSIRALNSSAWSKASWPLGAHYLRSEDAVSFAVYSKHATRIIVEIYTQALGEPAAFEFELKKNSNDDIWRAKLHHVQVGAFYAFRCWGQNWPWSSSWERGNSSSGFIHDVDDSGNRFNPNKILFDPYARELSHEKLSEPLREAGLNGEVYGTGQAVYRGRCRREWDTGNWGPKAVVVSDSTTTGVRPQTSEEDAAIYESHIRNLTCHPSSARLSTILHGIAGFEAVVDIPANIRGSYKAAGLMAPYIKALGFSAIELMPVHEVDNGEEAALDGSLNHWGYMTQSFFAPDRHYAFDQSPGGPTREFKAMVEAFHNSGLEVYLDVVYNHSGEGGNWGGEQDATGFVCLGGFDTTEYYVLTDSHYLVDGATGCGNQLNFSTPASKNLILDSLRYWIDDMGIDGFRFDLATVLGRKPNLFERENWDYQKRFFPQHELLLAISELGASKGVEMIAEAWDTWNTYEVGNFPSGWGEWNGRYRDAIRHYLKGDGNTQVFMDMVNGAYDLFNDQGGPQKSVNFISAHDGFNFLDLVSYNEKDNSQPYPFGPSDGGESHNNAWDSGGDLALRRQRVRNFWTILFFSRGVPLVVSGDEFARTQNGNNNPWNIHSVAMWNNYAMASSHAPNAVAVSPEQPELRYHNNFGEAECAADVNPLFQFAVFVANFRKRHKGLRQRQWGNFEYDDGDVSYFFGSTSVGVQAQEGDRCISLLINSVGIGASDLLLLINMWQEPVSFVLPEGYQWLRRIDTASWCESHFNFWSAEEAEPIADNYSTHPWSIVVLESSLSQ